MKISVVGTHCAGKSTLVDSISKYFNLPIIEEIASRYKKEERKDINTQIEILENQIKAEKMCKEFVSDRSVFDNIAYLAYYSKDFENYGELFRVRCITMSSSHLKDNPYDYIVFVDEYLPLVDNGVRDIDKKIQTWVYYWIKNRIYRFSGVFNIPVITVSGSTENRMMEIVKELMKDGKL